MTRQIHLAVALAFLLSTSTATADTTVDAPADDSEVNLAEGIDPNGYIDAVYCEDEQVITVEIWIKFTGESVFTKKATYEAITQPAGFGRTDYVWSVNDTYIDAGANAGGQWWVRLKSNDDAVANAMGPIAPSGD